MTGSLLTWRPDRCTSDLESTTIGRVTVIVWTGNTDDGGRMCCSAYIPTTDRQLPDGRMLIGRRVLDTTDRTAAHAMAIDLAVAAMRDVGLEVP